MKLFLDSSAFAKRFIEEPGSRAVEDLCRLADELGLSVICVPELVSALNRRLRDKSISRQDYLRARRRLALEVGDAMVVQLTPEVVRFSLELLEDSPLRTMDALQVASALAWEADLFCSADSRQVSAARRAGLITRRISSE
jgi:uncharacterized protein